MSLEVLKQCTVDGLVVKLRAGQLERDVYLNVKAKLEAAGGKWKGGKTQGFVFEEDPTALLERLASGQDINIKQDYQFFATPAELADMMISRIPAFDSHMRVLEPSAGDGALVKAFFSRFGQTLVRAVECYELMELNLTKLRDVQGAMIKGMDFLGAKVAEHEKYDIIIANPPFTRNQDIDHIRKMYEVCKPGGFIITVASSSWTFGSHKKQVEFRNWLTSVNAKQEEIPAGTFKASGTSVQAMLLEISKPQDNIIIPPHIPGVEKFVEARQKTKQLKERKCRVCGCTENYCRQCIEKTGEPCHWVEKDLCSACQEPLPAPEVILESIIQNHKESESILLGLKQLINSNNNDMKFFTNLQATAPGSDVTLRIKEKNGKFTVSIVNNVGGQSNIKPLIVTGEPQELDDQFFTLIGPPLRSSNVELHNLEEHKKSINAYVAEETKKSAPKKTESKTATEKPATEKPTEAKPGKEKHKPPTGLFSDDDDEELVTEETATQTEE